MKTIIAGSRDIDDYELFCKAIKEVDWDLSFVVSGGARGVDLMAVRYAKERNIPYRIYPANWNFYGKRAGYVRNCEMADNAEALFAIWDGKSRGTKNMIEIAKKRGMKVHIFYTKIQRNKSFFD